MKCYFSGLLLGIEIGLLIAIIIICIGLTFGWL
jgi:ABC-type dipeptide/oligopeptide/nickel transport system permease subunit